MTRAERATRSPCWPTRADARGARRRDAGHAARRERRLAAALRRRAGRPVRVGPPRAGGAHRAGRRRATGRRRALPRRRLARDARPRHAARAAGSRHAWPAAGVAIDRAAGRRPWRSRWSASTAWPAPRRSCGPRCDSRSCCTSTPGSPARAPEVLPLVCFTVLLLAPRRRAPDPRRLVWLLVPSGLLTLFGPGIGTSPILMGSVMLGALLVVAFAAAMLPTDPRLAIAGAVPLDHPRDRGHLHQPRDVRAALARARHRARRAGRRDRPYAPAPAPQRDRAPVLAFSRRVKAVLRALRRAIRLHDLGAWRRG